MNTVCRWGSLVPFAFAVGACSSAAESARPAPASAPAPRPGASLPAAQAIIGAPCALSNGSAAELEAASPRVFVEVARLEGDLTAILHTRPATADGAAPNTGGAGIVLDAGLESIAVHHVLAKNDEVKTISWDTERPTSDGSKAPIHWDMKLTPHVIASSPVGVSLEVDLVGAATNGAPPAAPSGDATVAHTTLVLRNQQTIIVGPTGNLNPTATRTVLAVTPYVLWDDADVGRLLECKREAAAAARRQPAAAPQR